MSVLKILCIIFVLIQNVHLNHPSKLKNDLLLDYDKTVRPVLNHMNATRVNVRMILKYFQMDIHSSTLNIDSWLSLSWTDEYLHWNPDDYNSVKTVHMTHDEIWLPDLSIYNRNDESGSPAIINTVNCHVHSNGKVFCVAPGRQSSLCIADLTKYPFDSQNCTLHIGSWVHSGEEIDFQLSNPPIAVVDLVPNAEWNLITYTAVKHAGHYQCCPQNTYPSLSFNFYLKRLSGAHAASIILPGIALMIITLSCLCIDPRNSTRISLCCVNLVCHFLYIEDLSWTIPLNGKKIPLIICYGRDSLVLGSFALVFSIILMNLMKKSKRPSPYWISTIVSATIKTLPGQFIFLDDTSTKGIASAKNEEDSTIIVVNSEVNCHEQDWNIFVQILDKLCFVIYVIVYIVMIISFVS